MVSISKRLTEKLKIKYPIVSAPMAFAGGGGLAAAVSRAGGLGLIGGGYGDHAWIEDQFNAAGTEKVGIGFITWSLRKSPSLLRLTLKHNPCAVMLSFGNPRPFVDEIRSADALIICQCQNISHVRDALEIGADIIVAQGSEAGGHGARRGTFTFVPEVADFCTKEAPDTLLLAAGGIADGRGLAAALMLGADGVLVGTRFWASKEALVGDRHHDSIVDATGDDTLRTTVPDIARRIEWPCEFTARVKNNAYMRRWHGRENLLKKNIMVEGPRYRQAFAQDDPDNTGVWFGEAAGLIKTIETAATIVERISWEAVSLLSDGNHVHTK